MARYIDAEQFREKHEVAEVNGKLNSVILYADIVYAPTADVVPRSEVEEIFEELMKELREMEDSFEKSANESYNCLERIKYRACQMGASLVSLKVAELKRKYTEEKQ